MTKPTNLPKMDLRSALKQLKNGSLSLQHAEKPSKDAEQFKKAEMDLFSLDGDDLFAFDQDSFESDFALPAKQGNDSRPTISSVSTKSISDTRLITPSKNIHTPKSTSLDKLQTFKFKKTRDSSTSSTILGKRNVENVPISKSGPSLPKKPTPSDNFDKNDIFDDILFSDFMDFDFGLPEENKLVSSQAHSVEHISTNRQHESHPTSNDLNKMDTLLPLSSIPSVFKAPSSRARTATPNANIIHSQSIPSTLTNRHSSSIPTTPCRPSNSQSSTPRPSSSQLSTPRPSSSQLSTPRPSSSQLSTPRPSSSQLSTPRPSSSQLSTPRPSSSQLSTPRPSNSRAVGPALQQYTAPTGKNIASSHQQRFATPLNTSHITTPCSSTSNFRTPTSRLPSAIVCTPGDDPLIIKTPHSARRRFPGPAGLLPALARGEYMDNVSIQPPSTPRPTSTPRVQSLSVCREVSSDDQCFSSGPWMAMLTDLDMNDSHSSGLIQYNIASAIAQAGSKRLRRGKVTHLRVLLKSIARAGRNASAVLKDPSGEILCTIHSKVFEDHQKELQPGAAIILRQVSLFSPAPRKHYLNITPDNVIRIYPPHSPHTSPQGLLDLSVIERMYNSENISPSSSSNGHSSTNRNTHMLAGRKSLTTQMQQNLIFDCDKDTTKSLDQGTSVFQTVARASNSGLSTSKDPLLQTELDEGSFLDQFCEDEFDDIINGLDKDTLNF